MTIRMSERMVGLDSRGVTKFYADRGGLKRCSPKFIIFFTLSNESMTIPALAPPPRWSSGRRISILTRETVQTTSRAY